MRLMTLNMQNRTATRQSELLAYLRTLAADILVLTETKWNARTEAFCRNLGDYRVEASTRDGEHAVLIASKWPVQVIRSAARFLEVSVPEVDLRIVGAYVPSPNPKKPERNAERAQFWKLLHERAVALQASSAIIVGDLNSFLPEDTHNATSCSADSIRELTTSGWRDAWPEFRDPADENRYTWHSRKGGFRLDYAFLSPALAKRARGDQARHDLSPRGLGFSDHAALVMDLSV